MAPRFDLSLQEKSPVQGKSFATLPETSKMFECVALHFIGHIYLVEQ